MQGARASKLKKSKVGNSMKVYKIIDQIVAFALVVVSLAAAEPPRFRASARQSVAPGTFQPPAPNAAPYNPRGWRPQGAALTLPRSQPQQAYGPPNPAPSYGPPPEEPSTEDYLGESTEPPQVAKISSKQTTAKTSATVQQQPQGAYYIVVPQSTAAVVVPQTQTQNLVYAVQKSAPLVAVPQATIVAAPLTTAQLQTLPVTTYKAVYSPLTASYSYVQQVDW